jgi:hypothetical protein
MTLTASNLPPPARTEKYAAPTLPITLSYPLLPIRLPGPSRALPGHSPNVVKPGFHHALSE